MSRLVGSSLLCSVWSIAHAICGRCGSAGRCTARYRKATAATSRRGRRCRDSAWTVAACGARTVRPAHLVLQPVPIMVKHSEIYGLRLEIKSPWGHKGPRPPGGGERPSRSPQ